MNPYHHEGTIRTFSKDVDEWDLIWHKDKQDRYITVLEGEGWKFQKDNNLDVQLLYHTLNDPPTYQLVF